MDVKAVKHRKMTSLLRQQINDQAERIKECGFMAKYVYDWPQIQWGDEPTGTYFSNRFKNVHNKES